MLGVVVARAIQRDSTVLRPDIRTRLAQARRIAPLVVMLALTIRGPRRSSPPMAPRLARAPG